MAIGRPGCVALLLFLAAFRGTAQQNPSFRSEVTLVNLTAIVRSTDGQLLRDLQKEDFELTEDGVPQTIQFFARETELPLSLGLLLDVSGSQDKFLKQHHRDVDTFLKTVLKPSDQAFAVCFGNHLRLVADTTSSADQIMAGLERFRKGDHKFPELGPREDRVLGTAVYDALYFSMNEKLRTSGERRRALLLFSDGEENSSEHDLLDALEAAQNTGTIIYCIRYTQTENGKQTARNKYGIRVMKHLATLSGGADFDAVSTQLDSVFAQISAELRSLYQFGFVSTNRNAHDGSFRQLIVRCKQPDAIVRAKSGYYAR